MCVNFGNWFLFLWRHLSPEFLGLYCLSLLINSANSTVIMRSLSKPVMMVAHPTYLVITYGPNKKTYSQCNITIFTQFRLQSLHQYIDCVVTIANVGSGALRYSAFLNT